MKEIIEKVKAEMIEITNENKNKTNFDHWNNHIRLVYERGHELAIERKADIEIVDLATILHDVARIKEIGPIEEHNKYGAEIAEIILSKYNYPKEKIEHVKRCIYNHQDNPKSSVEEEIVADADAVSHFDDLSTLYYLAFTILKLDFTQAKKFIKNKLEFDFKKLSPYGKVKYKERYEKILETLFGYNE